VIVFPFESGMIIHLNKLQLNCSGSVELKGRISRIALKTLIPHCGPTIKGGGGHFHKLNLH
jgi:hypothetical protein